MKYAAAIAWRGAIVISLFGLASCGWQNHGFLASAGPVAEAERGHFFAVIGWTLIVIVPLFVATPIVLWKYRLGRKDAAYRPNWTSSWFFEVLIWGLPLVIVAILGWNLWGLSHQLDPYKPIASDKSPLKIKVVGLNWKWLFIYPGQNVAAAGKLMLPTDRPISFRLTSATVMQSFYIPRLGSQIYTMPGMVTQLHLLAAKPGRYLGMNAQYNGEGFAAQQFQVHAVSEADFKHWVAQTHAKPPLDLAAYKEVAERSVLAEPKSYGSVSNKLFRQIVARTKATPASRTQGAKPKFKYGQKQETKRVKRQQRQYEQRRAQGEISR